MTARIAEKIGDDPHEITIGVNPDINGNVSVCVYQFTAPVPPYTKEKPRIPPTIALSINLIQVNIYLVLLRMLLYLVQLLTCVVDTGIFR